MKHWEEPKDEDDENRATNRWYYQARSTDIEQTAYVLLAMLENKGKKLFLMLSLLWDGFPNKEMDLVVGPLLRYILMSLLFFG